MSETMARFDRDLALSPDGDGFAFQVPDHWRVAAFANGGFLAALLTHALTELTEDRERRPSSLTIHYLRPARPGEAHLVASVERDGRAQTNFSARVMQQGRPIALALGAWSRPRKGLEYQDEAMPEAPPPEELPRLNRLGMPMAEQWEYRPCVGELPYAGSDRAITGGWIRPAEPRAVDAPLLAAMTDCWLPSVTTRFQEPAGSLPTIDLTIHFRAALPAPGSRPGDYCFALFRSQVARDGYWEEDATIWSRDGQVLVQSRQLAILG